VIDRLDVIYSDQSAFWQPSSSAASHRIWRASDFIWFFS